MNGAMPARPPMSPLPTHEPVAAAGADITRGVNTIPVTAIPIAPPSYSGSVSDPEPAPEPEPEPELKPLIAEVLRTRYCAPGSVVLVEGVGIAPTAYVRRRRRKSQQSPSQPQSQSQSQSQRQWRAIRLLLGDGELCVQALLAPEMHRYVDTGEVAFGSYIRLERFRIEWLDDVGAGADAKGKERERESAAQTVYLVVEDLIVIGWSSALVETARAEGDLHATSDEDSAMDEDQDGEAEAPSPSPPRSPSPSPSRARGERRISSTDKETKPQPEKPPQAAEHREEPADATDSDFELMPESVIQKAEQNRAALASALRASNPNPNSNSSSNPHPPRPRAPRAHPHPQQPRHHQPWLATDPAQPLKLTSLRGIPHLPYKQNWSVNVLAVVAWLSGVEPSGIPPYAQRRARLADPSTAKRVLLTVFLDPAEFAPGVGSVVLLLGVKNHRFDGGCLKKYDSDRPPPMQVHDEDGDGDGDGDGGEGEVRRWWFENPEEFGWCDVGGLRRWWGQQQQQQEQSMQM